MVALKHSGLAMRAFIAALLGIAVVAALTLYFVCPCSRLPGGYLLGPEVTQPVEDWSFANQVPLCQVEVRAVVPHSVNLNCMASAGRLYLSCANCADKHWSRAALERPAARLRIGEAVYPVMLTRVEDRTELDAAWRARATKLGATTVPPRAEGWWSFRATTR